ncbi:helix-turn-helix domain-containing protein [Rhodococcus sp. WS3]|uniref:helix-turn-helix domain-containing protein n=1 Tax=Rhodococcus sp. WS3 TaxID=2486271 RepID=UPI001650D936|nr:XRE family transcriptional regulator [Rhodococcus sp. WS3]
MQQPDGVNGTAADGASSEPPPSASKSDHGQVQLARARQIALIGKSVRALRHGRMTLSQLAQASNVSIGLLSRLENGTGNPSFASLSAIARALGVDVHSFFELPTNSGTVLSSSDRARLRMPHTDIEIELLVPSFHDRIIAVLMTLPPGFNPHTQATARTVQQFETPLDGSVEYHIEHEIHQIGPGDSILFEANRPHARRNMSDSTAATILSCSIEIQLESYFPADS